MLTSADLLIDESLVAIVSCMFDKGALQASFVRQSVVDSNPRIQQNLRACSVQVTLGDGSESSSVTVRTYVQLQVRCIDAAKVSHTTAPIWLLVMPKLA